MSSNIEPKFVLEIRLKYLSYIDARGVSVLLQRPRVASAGGQLRQRDHESTHIRYSQSNPGLYRHSKFNISPAISYYVHYPLSLSLMLATTPYDT